VFSEDFDLADDLLTHVKTDRVPLTTEACYLASLANIQSCDECYCKLACKLYELLKQSARRP